MQKKCFKGDYNKSEGHSRNQEKWDDLLKGQSHESKSITHPMLSGLNMVLLIILLNLATRISIRDKNIFDVSSKHHYGHETKGFYIHTNTELHTPS